MRSAETRNAELGSVETRNAERGSEERRNAERGSEASFSYPSFRRGLSRTRIREPESSLLSVIPAEAGIQAIAVLTIWFWRGKCTRLMFNMEYL